MNENLSIILSRAPIILNALGSDYCELIHDFNAFARIPIDSPHINGLPVLTTAFCGPSGAGKSTVFNGLTGLNVPAGGATRPMTHASLAVFPRCNINEQITAKLFAGFAIEELSTTADLRNPAAPNDRLFIAQTDFPDKPESYFPCLVDIPDFNTTTVNNWEKAELMIRRADTIIFTVSCESYKNKVTFEILQRILKLSGSVMYLLTKLSPDNTGEIAAEIRNDLLAATAADPAFSIKRTDGNSLAMFLESAPFFYSPYATRPCIEDIKSINRPDISFSNYLLGQKGSEILVSRHMQAISAGLECTDRICQTAEDLKDHTRSLRQTTEELLKDSAARITGEEFPVFHMLAMVRKTIEENRPTLLKRAFQPILFIGSGIKSVISSVHGAIKKLSRSQVSNDIKLRNDLERNRLAAEIENMIDIWQHHPDIPDFPVEKARKAAGKIIESDLPPVDAEWEESITASLMEWKKDNKNLWLWMNVINDIFILLGTGLFVADFFIDGGMGTLGVVAIIGGGSATGGFLLSLFNNMGLGKQVIQAHNNWKILRQKAYRKHLSQNFAGPLFLDAEIDREEKIDDACLNDCRLACSNLKEILARHAQST